jgi:hypothetical protein
MASSADNYHNGIHVHATRITLISFNLTVPATKCPMSLCRVSTGIRLLHGQIIGQTHPLLRTLSCSSPLLLSVRRFLNDSRPNYIGNLVIGLKHTGKN